MAAAVPRPVRFVGARVRKPPGCLLLRAVAEGQLPGAQKASCLADLRATTRGAGVACGAPFATVVTTAATIATAMVIAIATLLTPYLTDFNIKAGPTER